MTDQTKVCPFCAEVVLNAAIKCKHCGSDISSGGPESSNKILLDLTCTLSPGNSNACSGRLKLTEQRLVFEPGRLNIKKVNVSLSYTEIIDITKQNMFLFIPHGILVGTKTGLMYHFMLWGRDPAFDLISSKIRSN